MACEHRITEMDTAVIADGMCPLCLAAEIARLRAALTEIRDAALYNDHLIKEAVIKRCEGALEQLDP